jgi:hypothetical protein
VFPVRHFAGALLTAYDPHTYGAGIAGADRLIVAIWVSPASPSRADP